MDFLHKPNQQKVGFPDRGFGVPLPVLAAQLNQPPVTSGVLTRTEEVEVVPRRHIHRLGTAARPGGPADPNRDAELPFHLSLPGDHVEKHLHASGVKREPRRTIDRWRSTGSGLAPQD